VTVVEMTDFECPHCRRADAVVREVRGRRDIHLVRLVVPMDMHLNAKHAGRAYLAALRQGKGEEMAAALYAEETPTAERCRQRAAELGLDLAEYDRALEDPAIDAELYANVRLSRELGKGVPVIWVQDRRLTGNPTAEELAAALDDAIRKAQPPGP
jgi:protein-disulfide isomerase